MATVRICCSFQCVANLLQIWLKSPRAGGAAAWLHAGAAGGAPAAACLRVGPRPFWVCQE